MSKVLSFIGSLLITCHNYAGNLLFGVVLLALGAKLLGLFTSMRYYKSIKLGDKLQPQIEKLNEKYKKNTEKRSEMITKLLMQNGYPMLGSIGNFILEALIGVLIGFALRTPKVYLPGIEETVYNINLSASPASMLFADSSTDIMLIFLSLVLVALCAFLQYYHDMLMSKKLIIEQEAVDKIILGLVIVGAVLLPQAFSVFWIATKLLDLAHYYIMDKFVKVSPVSAAVVKEANSAEKKK